MHCMMQELSNNIFNIFMFVHINGSISFLYLNTSWQYILVSFVFKKNYFPKNSLCDKVGANGRNWARG